jgi:death-on-curing family protein
MNKGRPIIGFDINIFSILLQLAQEAHNKKGEPIPDIGKDGIGKIESSLATPFQSYDGRYLYKTFNKKATALFYFLIKNHCLQNGNKRMAIISLSFFIYINNKSFQISDNCLYALAKKTANSQNKQKAFYRIDKILRKKVRHRTHQSAMMDGLTKPRSRHKNKMRKIFT